MILARLGVICCVAITAQLSPVLGQDMVINRSPISFEPEPVTQLHPQLQWMRTDKIRGAWVATELYLPYGDTDKTRAQIMADGGFNVAVVSSQVNPKNRSVATALEDILPANIRAAHDSGLALWTKWNYGSQHQDPYHRYRAPDGKLAKKTSCPLDERYVERHIGRWAVLNAKAGADGFIVDTEMYGSDVADYAGPCICDYCFRTYADAFAQNSDAVYDGIDAELRGVWLRQDGSFGHYSRFARRRIEDLYDGIRARCQALNPAFVFGYAGLVEHIPGITRGFGTSSVPCVVFDESQYTTGPTFTMQRDLRYLRRTDAPALYVCGLWLHKTRPQKLAERALLSSLYADGWWVWFGAALLVEPDAVSGTYTKEPYGRFPATPAAAYWEVLKPMHVELSRLLAGPRKAWPGFPFPTNMIPPPRGKVATKTGPIALDGNLDDPGWQAASRFDMAKDRYDKSKGPENTFWLCYDQESLYFAARCPIPPGTKLAVPGRGRDHPTAWRNDGLELFIDPTGKGLRYAQIVISALGDTYESALDFSPGSAQFGDLGWNPLIEVAARQTETEYVLEMRLKFDKFLPQPQANDTWGFNVCRATSAVQTWSPTYGHFQTPSRFGRIQFNAPTQER
jgi:hypothetical protein